LAKGRTTDNLLVEPAGGRRRLDVEFLRQYLPATFELARREAALILLRIEAHEGAVGGLPQGIEPQEALSRGDTCLMIAFSQKARQQAVDRIDRQFV
jgi:hypothetical protein